MADPDKVRRDREVAETAFILSDPRGRAFVMRIMTWCGLNRSVFTMRPEVRREDWVVFNGAQLDVANYISREVKCADPTRRLRTIMESEEEARLIMEEEAKKKQKQKEKQDADDGGSAGGSGGESGGDRRGGESGE